VFSGLSFYRPNQEWKADEAAESLIEAGLIEPILIVAIDNAAIDNAGEKRTDECLPIRTGMKMVRRSVEMQTSRSGKAPRPPSRRSVLAAIRR
jgi:hypothetical protein